MAYTNLTLKNPQTNDTKIAPVGFSWTVFFFGPIPAFLRGDIKGGFMMLLLGLITGGLVWFYYIFQYNKMYIKNLITKGYRVVSNDKALVDEISIKVGLLLPLLESSGAK